MIILISLELGKIQSYEQRSDILACFERIPLAPGLGIHWVAVGSNIGRGGTS